MPPVSRILEVLVYSLLNFFPFLVLALYPFRHCLRFSKVIVGTSCSNGNGIGRNVQLLGRFGLHHFQQHSVAAANAGRIYGVGAAGPGMKENAPSLAQTVAAGPGAVVGQLVEEQAASARSILLIGNHMFTS